VFEFCRLRCVCAELHAPSSSGLDELLVGLSTKLVAVLEEKPETTPIILERMGKRLPYQQVSTF